jgi:predicted RNA-binding protein YlqC (UPF0109 family)
MSDNIRECLLQIVQMLTEQPDDVKIDAVEGQPNTFRIRANPKDLGDIIGKQGKTVESLRVLAAAMGVKLGARIALIVDDTAEPES